jgi:hypothetical protein
LRNSFIVCACAGRLNANIKPTHHFTALVVMKRLLVFADGRNRTAQLGVCPSTV